MEQLLFHIWLFFVFFSFLLGSVFGSFLNVCIWRIPRHEPLSKGRSHCTACGTTIRAYDLIPVLSYLLLRGKCRHCGSPISARYPLVELLGGVLFALCFVVYGYTVHTLILMAAVSVLLALAFIDYDTQEIPNRFPVLLLLLGVLDLFVTQDIPWFSRLIGFLIISVPLLLLSLITGGMGGGDVKLMAAAGFLLGWQGVLLASFLGFVLGGAIAAVLWITGRKTRGEFIALGPYLSIGIAAAALFGQPILAWYLSLL